MSTRLPASSNSPRLRGLDQFDRLDLLFADKRGLRRGIQSLELVHATSSLCERV